MHGAKLSGFAPYCLFSRNSRRKQCRYRIEPAGSNAPDGFYLIQKLRNVPYQARVPRLLIISHISDHSPAVFPERLD